MLYTEYWQGMERDVALGLGFLYTAHPGGGSQRLYLEDRTTKEGPDHPPRPCTRRSGCRRHSHEGSLRFVIRTSSAIKFNIPSVFKPWEDISSDARLEQPGTRLFYWPT